jgi:hypothetical protein
MADLPAVFDELRRRLSLYENEFRVTSNLTDANRPTSRKEDDPSPGDTYMLLGAPHEKYPEGMLFAGVKQQKRYVSFYLMPVYSEADLHSAISQDLRKRMQGKSCFNFTRVDEGLFDELMDLTARGRDAYADKGWLA